MDTRGCRVAGVKCRGPGASVILNRLFQLPVPAIECDPNPPVPPRNVAKEVQIDRSKDRH